MREKARIRCALRMRKSKAEYILKQAAGLLSPSFKK